MVTHIFKNGITASTTKDVCVPKEIVKEIYSIAKTKTKGEKKDA